ncbi:MAG TPA: magnesium and cobalt transport protein CorA [Acidimicrobiales bacterium]
MIVDCAAYQQGERIDGRLDVDAAGKACRAPDTFVWLGLRVPSAEELGHAFERFGIEEPSVEEVLQPHERPVLAVEDDATSLVLRTAHFNANLEQVKLGEMSVLVGQDFVITVRHGQASPLSGLRLQLERDPEYLALGPPAVLAAVIETVVDDYQPALDGFERTAVEVESEVFGGDVGSRAGRRIYRLRRELRELVVAVEALEDPLARLLRRQRGRWPAEVVGTLEEAFDQLTRTISRARSLSDLLASALDANLAQLSVQQNEDMRKISAWVAIAAVPTAIAGIYGMNFEEMPELRSAWGYPLVLGGMALICLFLYRRFRSAGWL